MGRRLLYAAGVVSICAGVLVLALSLVISIQQRILYHRAEDLLADFQGIELQHSGWAEAQRLRAKWGKYGRYEGQCTAARCVYTVRLADWIQGRHPIFDNAAGHLVYAALGGRWELVDGVFLVEDGKIQRKSFDTMVDVAEGTYKPKDKNDYSGEYALMGRVVSGWSLRDALGVRAQLANHPTYQIGEPSGCSNCISINVVYNLDTSGDTAHSLMAFNLTCLIGRTHCFDERDILPYAGDIYLKERTGLGEEAQREKAQTPAACVAAARTLGRDSTHAAVVDVLTDLQRSGDEPNPNFASAQLRILEVLKGRIGASVTMIATTYSELAPGNTLVPDVSLKKGRRYIVFHDDRTDSFRHPTGDFELSNFNLQECNAMDYSPEALAAVKAGVESRSQLRGEELRKWGYVGP